MNCPHCGGKLPLSLNERWRQRRAAEGYCWENCGRPVAPGRKRCVECLAKSNARAKAYYARKRLASQEGVSE